MKVFDEHKKCIKFTYHIKPLLKLAWIYPNNDFSSYRECDEEYLKNVLASFTPSSLMPVWLTDQMDKVTSSLQITDWGKYGRSIFISTFLAGNESNADYADLWDGTQASPCPLPCTTWSTNTRLLGEHAIDNQTISKINLTFAPKVNTPCIDIQIHIFIWV